MSILPSYAVKIYRILIRCYPATFRRVFEEEMTADFVDAVTETQHIGGSTLFKLIFFEYSHIIRTALHLHTESRRQDTLYDTNTWEGPPGWVESLVTLIVFVLPGLTLYMGNDPTTPGFVFWAGLLLCSVILFGLKNGLPRWSLPYFGLALSAFSFIFIFQWTADLTAMIPLQYLGISAQNESEQLILQAFWAGFAWISLFALTYLILRLLALMHHFQITLQRIHQDWTQASYILYSGAVITLFITFIEHHRKDEFVVASTLCLAAGAWLYLNCKLPLQRLLALSGGATLALIAAAVGLIPPLPVTEWAAWFASQPTGMNNIMAIRKLLLELAWLLILLLAPAFLRVLPGNPANNSHQRLL